MEGSPDFESLQPAASEKKPEREGRPSGYQMRADAHYVDQLTSRRGERAYTDRAAKVLAALLPDNLVGSVSTVPGTFKSVAASRPDAARAMADNMARHVATLVAIGRRSGRGLRW